MNIYRKIVSRSCFTITFLLLLSFATTTGADPNRFSPERTLIIGANKDFTPYEFLNKEGNPDGYSIDLMKAVAKTRGIKIEFRLDTFSNLRRDLIAKKIDAVTGMLFTKERNHIFDFSIPHLIIPYGVFKRKETQIHNILDIMDKEIIVVKDVYSHEWLIENKITNSIIAVTEPTEALRLLASGRGVCAILPRLHGLDLLEGLKIKNVEPVGPPAQARSFCFAVAEGNADLLAELNKGLFAVQQSGEYKKIYLKWFSVHEHKKSFRKWIFYWTMF